MHNLQTKWTAHLAEHTGKEKEKKKSKTTIGSWWSFSERSDDRITITQGVCLLPWLGGGGGSVKCGNGGGVIFLSFQELRELVGCSVGTYTESIIDIS